MMLVSVGTMSYTFPRLIRAVMALPVREKVIIQAGDYDPGNVADNIELRDYIPHAQMTELYTKADYVISAAGEGSVMLMVQYCKNKPILFPRQKKYGEHVDDQQVEIAKAAVKKGYAEMAMNEEELKGIIHRPSTYNNYIKQGEVNEVLVAYLEEIMM